MERLKKEFPQVMILDPTEDFVDAELKTPGKIFSDGLHLLADGNRLMANKIAGELIKNKLIN
ncbi:MAG: hypothetical protein HQL27_07295 [Candidatus Omnitrophica bacterium]|nr:hypothetical protein [Candidatus Omnitrophota bacterium]